MARRQSNFARWLPTLPVVAAVLILGRLLYRIGWSNYRFDWQFERRLAQSGAVVFMEVVLALLAMAVVVVLIYFWRRGVPLGHCVRCRFDLRNCPDASCPDCGVPREVALRTSQSGRVRSVRLRRCKIVLGFLTVGLLLAWELTFEGYGHYRSAGFETGEGIEILNVPGAIQFESSKLNGTPVGLEVHRGILCPRFSIPSECSMVYSRYACLPDRLAIARLPTIEQREYVFTYAPDWSAAQVGDFIRYLQQTEGQPVDGGPIRAWLKIYPKLARYGLAMTAGEWSSRPTVSSTRVVAPLWIPWVVLLIPTVALYWRDRAFPPGYCGTCGYNLTGAPHDHCPECGEPVISARNSLRHGSEQAVDPPA